MTKKRNNSYGWVVVFAVGISIMLQWGICSTAFSIYVPEIAKTLNLSTTVVVGSYSVGFVVYLIWCFIAGVISDKIGARPVLITGVIGAALGQILLGFANSGWQLYLIYGVLGEIGQAFAWVGGISIVSRWFVKKRGLALGIAQGFAGIGAFFSIVAEIVVESFGWQTSTWILGLSMLLLSIPLMILIREPKIEVESESEVEFEASTESADGGFTFKQAIFTPQFWLIFLVAIVCMLGIGISVDLKDLLVCGGYSGMLAATLLTIAGITSTLGSFTFGWISDHLGCKKTIILGYAMKMGAVCIGIFAFEQWHFIFWAIIGGFASGVTVVFASLLADWYGSGIHGKLFGIFQGAESIGGSAGPVLIGFIGNYFYWRAPFIMMSMLLGASLLILLFMKRPRLEKQI